MDRAGERQHVERERRFALDGSYNLRHIGGYAGAGGRLVRWGGFADSLTEAG